MIKQLPQGALGFDTNQTLTLETAKEFKAIGYSFAIRYIPFLQSAVGDITTQEINDIVNAGLGLLLVQHCRPPGWIPSGTLGTQDANRAIAHLNAVGMPKGVNVYLDLEGVRTGTPTGDTLAFCNNWYDIIESAGYVPGIYVGANCGLSGDALYHGLKFQHYWKSGSNVPDIPTRGYEMVQTAGKSVCGISIDEDTVMVDKLYNSPRALFADLVQPSVPAKTLLKTLTISFYSDGSYEIK
jgi:hypothetical protein